MSKSVEIKMEIVGYLASILAGLSLGLIGGGGSILTVPILVYLFSVSPVNATEYSLFIVGITSLIGVIPLYREKSIDFSMAVRFGIPSALAVIFARKVILPAIPEEIILFDSVIILRRLLIMLFFAMVMIAASLFMIFRKEKSETELINKVKNSLGLILAESISVGTISGISGAGGGFLIIPLLTILNKVPMKKAIGTSLLIIGVQSMIGFFAGLPAANPDWDLLLKITTLSVSGFFTGNYLSVKFSARTLRNTFGWFVLCIGIYIILKELHFLMW
ncbi:sulfite exporter TauE/SafE family protein [Dyadobacter subterraneus]|nr:sulfite exporter TauE/SafE family protein [Dyadobacter subterraneus]